MEYNPEITYKLFRLSQNKQKSSTLYSIGWHTLSHPIRIRKTKILRSVGGFENEKSFQHAMKALYTAELFGILKEPKN